jgi:hypothetical protein
MASILLLSHASQLAENVFTWIARPILPLRLPSFQALSPHVAYGQGIQRSYPHPNNVSYYDTN